MKVELIGFSQGVSLLDRDKTVNYLDMRKEDGTIFRLPVPEETLHLLLAEVYEKAQGSLVEETPAQEEPTEDPPEFGGDFSREATGEEVTPEPSFVDETPPQTEEEVPSV